MGKVPVTRSCGTRPAVLRTTCLFVFMEEPYNVKYSNHATSLFVLLLVRHVLANDTSLESQTFAYTRTRVK